MNSASKKWFEKIPHAVTLLFGIIVLVTILTYILPAGTYERILVDGRNRVVPGSYKLIDPTPINLLEMFEALPLGFKAASEIIFIVLAGGIMFGMMEKTTAIENAVGTFVKKMGANNQAIIIVVMTFVYGFMGVAVGYENNIALVPIAAVLSLAIGGDLVLAAGISVGAMTIGFGLSPINPYTVGTGHKIAELQLFSGALLRSILCFSALSLMAYYNLRYYKKIAKDRSKSLGHDLNTEGFTLSKSVQEYRLTMQNIWVLSTFCIGMAVCIYGVFNFHWYINELSAVFLMITIVCGLIARINLNEMSENVLASVAKAAPGAFMVGYATSIKILMENGNIADTISYNLSEMLQGIPAHGSALLMSVSQCIINFFIPSGSGQALATLPVMIPIGDLIGITRQTTILAYQVGDGVTNLINPTLGGLIAMLSMCRVPLDRWLRFILPMALIVLIISWIALIIAVTINYQ